MSTAIERLKGYKNNMAAFSKASPEVMQAFGKVHMAASKPGALEAKHSELICIAIAVANKCEPCILAHLELALKAGVTREELVEALNSVILMCGGPAWSFSGLALNAYDEMVAAQSK